MRREATCRATHTSVAVTSLAGARQAQAEVTLLRTVLDDIAVEQATEDHLINDLSTQGTNAKSSGTHIQE